MGLRAVRSFAAFAVITALSAEAGAQPNDNEAWDGGYDMKAERRSDFWFGASAGLLVGAASGYPNEIDKVDDPRFESKTGAAFGSGLSLWLGGALTDWFSFGLGPIFLNGSGSEGSMSGFAIVMKVETFPLYSLGGGLRDLAIFADFGAGGLAVDGAPADEADGGLTSIIGVGSAYELFRFSRFAVAPTAEYLLVRSPTVTAHTGILGARIAFYGGPT